MVISRNGAWRQFPQCEAIIYPSARHELMLEDAKTREMFWDNVLRFLKDMKAIPA